MLSNADQFSIHQSLGDMAAHHPAATHVFVRHRLDFCCGGRQTLADACAHAGLDPKAILEEIKAEAREAPTEAWTNRSLSSLIDHIVSHYHERLRRDLPGLIESAEKIERVHGSKDSCPKGLAEHLRNMRAEIEQHLEKEEQVLFPAIVAGARGTRVQMPIRVMMHEHDDHGVNLERMRRIATGFVPPSEACKTWRALYASLEKLEAELMEHIHLENNLLFPRALDA